MKPVTGTSYESSCPNGSNLGTDSSADIEMQGLLKPMPIGDSTRHSRAGPKGNDSFFQRLDDKVNVKLLSRIWGPKLETVVRLMLVSTFLDDSLRTATNFTQLSKQVSEEGCLRWLSSSAIVFASIFLFLGLLFQLIGSILLVSLKYPDYATRSLIIWSILQPILYGQLSNFEFVAESLSLIGGLLMLRSHVVYDPSSEASKRARVLLFGRLLVPAMYVYYAGHFMFKALTEEETSSVSQYFASLSLFVVNLLVIVGLVIGSSFVAAGLRSRVIALLLALINIIYVFYNHPFFLYVSRKDGEWVYDDNMPIPAASLPDDVSIFDFDLEQIYDLHRYYFFMGLSTSGALLLLAQFGPGEYAVQEDETILPMRAQD